MSAPTTERPGTGADFEPTTWTGSIRKRWLHTLPPEKMLPETQPSYVSSWIYVFGMLTIVSLLVVLVSGAILTLGGVQWFHTSSIGLFVNSLHYWSVQLFFLFMLVHLAGKFWMAAWRGASNGSTWPPTGTYRPRFGSLARLMSNSSSLLRKRQSTAVRFSPTGTRALRPRS